MLSSTCDCQSHDMQTITSLPTNYVSIGTLNLSKNIPVLIAMNVFGSILLLPSGWLFFTVAIALRPEAGPILALGNLITTPPDGGFTLSLPAPWIIGLLVALVLVVVIHEFVHGVFFWHFTHRRPVFGLGLFAAFAAPPAGVFVPRNQYFVVTLAPLVVLTLLGLLLVPILPTPALPTDLSFITLNAAGTMGDLFVAAWLLARPSALFVQDTGDTVTLFGPAQKE